MADYLNKYPTLSDYTSDASDRKSLGGSTVSLIGDDGPVKYDKGLNPLHLQPFTIRCKFNTAGQPTPPAGGVSSDGAWSAVTWDSVTKVDADGYIWDITKNSTDWTNLLRAETTLVEVLGANSTGVTIMAHIFRACSNLSSVSLFDTSSVTTTESMFNGCYPLETIPLFNISSCSNTRLMFSYCTSLIRIPALDTHNVTTTQQMFYKCGKLKSIPNLDLSRVTIASTMFSESGIEYIKHLNTSSLITARQMFKDCTELKKIESLDTSKANDIAGIFYGCTALTTIPSIDTSNCTDMSFLCNRCASLTEIPLLNTSKVTNIKSAFYICHKVQSGALALYQQLSTQANPPSEHNNTFYECGKDTVTGAAELAQIPSTWGGTAS